MKKALFILLLLTALLGAEDFSSFTLPDGHPAKKALDRIFTERLSKTSESLKKAGFTSPEPRKYSGTVVSSHPQLPGYLIKLYTDDQEVADAEEKLMKRLLGSLRVREAITQLHYETLFKAPQKWLYPLPGEQRPRFILVVEDMELLSYSQNLKIWRDPRFPKGTLFALYTLLQEAGLKDSVYAFNLPYAKDGRIAITDTLYTDQWPVPFDCLLQFLSPENRIFWKKICN